MVSRTLENPSTPLGGAEISAAVATADQLWGKGTRDADPMRVGAAFRCVQIISASVAGCPIKTYNRKSHEPVEIPALTLERAGTSPFERMETAVAHQALWGNAYLRKIRTRDGRLIDLVPIHPSRVEVKVEDGNAVGLPWVKRFRIDGGKVSLTEYDVMHVPNMSLDGVQGLSVIGNMRRTFGLLTAAEQHAMRMYEDGLLTAGYLSTDKQLTEEQATIVKARWRARTAGLDNAYDVSVLDNGAKFEQLSMKPVDAQFLESRQFQTTEIARIFGVPGWIINDQEKSTSWGTGMEQQFISFVVITLKPYMHRFEQRITREVLDPKTEKAEFKLEGLLRGDSKSRAAFYNAGITGGWMVPNDIRPLEDMPDVPWGNKPYRPYNEPANGRTTTSGDDDDDDADA